jgi:hypothetical protein
LEADGKTTTITYIRLSLSPRQYSTLEHPTLI